MLPLLASLCLSPPPTCPPLSVLSMPPNPASPLSAPTQVVEVSLRLRCRLVRACSSVLTPPQVLLKLHAL
jgi:hypothetical protein